jgi:hypothetical protein
MLGCYWLKYFADAVKVLSDRSRGGALLLAAVGGSTSWTHFNKIAVKESFLEVGEELARYSTEVADEFLSVACELSTRSLPDIIRRAKRMCRCYIAIRLSSLSTMLRQR